MFVIFPVLGRFELFGLRLPWLLLGVLATRSCSRSAGCTPGPPNAWNRCSPTTSRTSGH